MATLTFSVTTLSGAGTPLHSGTIVLPLTAVTGPSTTTRDACSAGALPLDDGVGFGPGVVGVQANTSTDAHTTEARDPRALTLAEAMTTGYLRGRRDARHTSAVSDPAPPQEKVSEAMPSRIMAIGGFFSLRRCHLASSRWVPSADGSALTTCKGEPTRSFVSPSSSVPPGYPKPDPGRAKDLMSTPSRQLRGLTDHPDD